MSSFVDYVKIFCEAGHGGAGAVSFHSDKRQPRGGPDGGDGGKGGSVYIEGDDQKWTLLDFQYKRHYKAETGENGKGANKSGKDGRDIIISVPIGTVAKNIETGKIIAEVLKPKQLAVLTAGGRGGLGNTHFKSPVRRSPRYAQPGEEGERKEILLELKLLADVGLVGFPNAGKSTLLAKLTAAKPKIADYPFTTLVPNLGIVRYKDSCSFALADIPGIIEGASQGKGLGLKFLRHIERNSILLFVVPADSGDIRNEYDILLCELKKYNPDLLMKDRMIGISKSDLLSRKREKEIIKKLQAEVPCVCFSAHHGRNLEKLKEELFRLLRKN